MLRIWLILWEMKETYSKKVRTKYGEIIVTYTCWAPRGFGTELGVSGNGCVFVSVDIHALRCGGKRERADQNDQKAKESRPHCAVKGFNEE